jgi:hypothetical protein
MKVMSILETSFQEKTLGWSSHVEMWNRKLVVVGEGSEHLSLCCTTLLAPFRHCDKRISVRKAFAVWGRW